jgi:hypothetical protein
VKIRFVGDAALAKAGSYIKYKFPYAGEEKWEGHYTCKDGDKSFMHDLP